MKGSSFVPERFNRVDSHGGVHRKNLCECGYQPQNHRDRVAGELVAGVRIDGSNYRTALIALAPASPTSKPILAKTSPSGAPMGSTTEWEAPRGMADEIPSRTVNPGTGILCAVALPAPTHLRPKLSKPIHNHDMPLGIRSFAVLGTRSIPDGPRHDEPVAVGVQVP